MSGKVCFQILLGLFCLSQTQQSRALSIDPGRELVSKNWCRGETLFLHFTWESGGDEVISAAVDLRRRLGGGEEDGEMVEALFVGGEAQRGDLLGLSQYLLVRGDLVVLDGRGAMRVTEQEQYQENSLHLKQEMQSLRNELRRKVVAETRLHILYGRDKFICKTFASYYHTYQSESQINCKTESYKRLCFYYQVVSCK